MLHTMTLTLHLTDTLFFYVSYLIQHDEVQPTRHRLSIQNGTNRDHLNPGKHIPADMRTNRLTGGRNSPYSGKAGV